MRTSTLLLAATLLLVGCGDDDTTDVGADGATTGDGTAAGTCLAGTEDCADDPSGPATTAAPPGEAAPPSGPATTAAPPGDATRPPEPDSAAAEPAVPQPGTVDPRAAPIEGFVFDDPRTATTVEALYYQGVEPCDVLDRVEVTETDDEVTVTVFVGTDPDTSADTVCIAVAELRSATVELGDPLEGRLLSDGSGA